MGYRTVVMLNDDVDWRHDKNLAQKIWAQTYNISQSRYSYSDGIKVVEHEHADTSTLAVLGYYKDFTPLTYNHSRHLQKNLNLELLRRAAADLGYDLVKKD